MMRFIWAFGAFGWSISAVKIAMLLSSVDMFYAWMGCVACLLIALTFVLRAVENKAWDDGL